MCGLRHYALSLDKQLFFHMSTNEYQFNVMLGGGGTL